MAAETEGPKDGSEAVLVQEQLEVLARVLEQAANVLRLGQVEGSLQGVRWVSELLERASGGRK